MELRFRIAARIARPVSEVFEAVADPAQLSAYFTTGGARGRLETGATVTWSFADYPGEFPVEVVEVVPDRRIVFRWQAYEVGEEGLVEADYQTETVMEFTPLDDGRTLVEISEHGWRETPAGLKGSYNNCEGWSQMACALKAWLEHGINLREGMYA